MGALYVYHKHEGSHLGEFAVSIAMMMECRNGRWMIVEIVNIPIAFIVIVQETDRTRTEKHGAAMRDCGTHKIAPKRLLYRFEEIRKPPHPLAQVRSHFGIYI